MPFFFVLVIYPGRRWGITLYVKRGVDIGSQTVSGRRAKALPRYCKLIKVPGVCWRDLWTLCPTILSLFSLICSHGCHWNWLWLAGEIFRVTSLEHEVSGPQNPGVLHHEIECNEESFLSGNLRKEAAHKKCAAGTDDHCPADGQRQS
jgi:hypothetical protein